MKHLLLLRHGKSEWDQQGREDFERALTEDGRRASLQIAGWLKAHVRLPDHVMASPALRTRQTWETLQGALGNPPAADFIDELYLAAPGTILKHVEAVPDTAKTVLVVGHNPGLEVLARMLAGPDPDPDLMRGLMLGIPTTGLAVFSSHADSWSGLSAEGTTLEDFVRAEELD